MSEKFRAFVVQRGESGLNTAALAEISESELPPGDVTIDVAYSSVNYKDALAAQAHPGVVRNLPHVPGIDAAGTVRVSSDNRYPPGTPVLVTGYELGSGRWGGWSERIRVPADWVVPLPTGMSPLEAMALGTAGFTAAQCVLALQRCEITPERGEVVVTGASGGVGSVAVKLLSQLDYQVVASTGKLDEAGRIVAWGAKRVVDRNDLESNSTKPLLSARWAAGVDTVGGNTLTTVLRETMPYGCVAACGLVAGSDLQMTVHPFLLRGITLAGIASAGCPYDKRVAIWELLADKWRVKDLSELTTIVPLTNVRDVVTKILRGQILGRTVVQIK